MKEKIYFKNSNGDKLCGILSNPTDATNIPIVVMCHGFSSSKVSRTYVTLEEKLNQKDIATFRFDFFGHGESEGAFEEITVSEGVDDVLQAIAYLKQRGHEDIALLGSSYGGSVAINAAARTKDIKALVLRAPVVNWTEKIFHKSQEGLDQWRERGWWEYTSKSTGKKYKVNYSFVEDFPNSDGYRAGERIEIPTLIIHGDKDESVPIQQSIKLDILLSNSILATYPGADHQFSNENDFKSSLQRITEFIIEYLS